MVIGELPGESNAVFSLLARDIRCCRRCPGLNIPGETEAAPGYGRLSSRIVVVGQSLCGPCMASQIPFTGGSGRLLDQALKLASLTKDQIFTTNLVHCHPPNNRRSTRDEIRNCSEYLRRELDLINPILIVGLGQDAAIWLASWANDRCQVVRGFASPLQKLHDQIVLLLAHPAYILRRPKADRQTYVVGLANILRLANETDSSK